MIAASMTVPFWVLAQTAQPTGDLNFWEKAFGTLTMVGAAIVIAGALLAIVRLFSVIIKMEELRILKEKGVEEIVETYRQPKESLWKRFQKYATKAVPVTQEKDILFDHEYDGIRELDNRLPPWWLWLFYFTILFSVVYWFAFHVTDIGPSSKEEYDRSMEKAKAEVAAYVARQADAVNEDNVVALTDETDLSLGKSIFTANCVACHGNAGEGNTIGPNLTDEYWLHGGGIKNIFKTIKNGVVEKGMQSWKETLRASDMQRVSSYILTLQGTNPPNAKAPQGEIWKEEGGEAPADTTKIGG